MTFFRSISIPISREIEAVNKSWRNRGRADLFNHCQTMTCLWGILLQLMRALLLNEAFANKKSSCLLEANAFLHS